MEYEPNYAQTPYIPFHKVEKLQTLLKDDKN